MISLPSLEEQARVAAHLAAAETQSARALANAERLVETARQLRFAQLAQVFGSPNELRRQNPLLLIDGLARIGSEHDPQADFWIQRSGSDHRVGRPFREFMPHHFSVRVLRRDVIDPRWLYYVAEYAWAAGLYRPRAHGTLMLQHVRQRDVADVLGLVLSRAVRQNPGESEEIRRLERAVREGRPFARERLRAERRRRGLPVPARAPGGARKLASKGLALGRLAERLVSSRWEFMSLDTGWRRGAPESFLFNMPPDVTNPAVVAYVLNQNGVRIRGDVDIWLAEPGLFEIVDSRTHELLALVQQTHPSDTFARVNPGPAFIRGLSLLGPGFERHSKDPARGVKGLVLYEGPSPLAGVVMRGWDGRMVRIGNEPIVLIATLQSANRKTGNMVQTWVLLRDQHPSDAMVSGADAAICGFCPHRRRPRRGGRAGEGPTERSCYVSPRYVNRIWDAYRRGIYRPVAPEALELVGRALGDAGYLLRIGSYGDPAAVPAWVWERLLGIGSPAGMTLPVEPTCYTHQWAYPLAAPLRAFCQASVDSLEEARRAQALGWRTFRVGLERDPATEILCPASGDYEALHGSRRTCRECRLCCGKIKGAARSIFITPHGAGAKTARARLENPPCPCGGACGCERGQNPPLTPEKALQILRDGGYHDRAGVWRELTPAQRRFFGLVASGKVPRRGR